MKRSAVLAASLTIGIAALSTGSGCMMGQSRPQPASGGASRQKVMDSPSPETWANVKKQAQSQLDSCQDKTKKADEKLDAVIAAFSGKGNDAMGQPVLPISQALAALKKQKVTASIDNVGSDMMPTFLIKDSLMDEAKTLAGKPQAVMMAYAKRMQAAQPALNALRADAQAVTAALQASFESSATCSQGAKGYSTMLGAIENGGDSPPDDVFDVYAKLLQANARAEAVAAASVALLSVTQATMTTTKDTSKAMDTLLGGIGDLKAHPEEVTTDQARKVYKAAGQALIDACQANLDKYFADHPDAKKPDGPSPCSKEGLAKDKEKWNKGPGANDATASEGGDSGSSGLEDELVARLAPKDSIQGQAMAAYGALKKGDVVGALKGTLKMVGKNMPFGGVISSVLSIFG